MAYAFRNVARSSNIPFPPRDEICTTGWRWRRCAAFQSFTRRCGEALHSDREPLATFDHIRRTLGEYNFAGQYQQSPAPLA